MNFLNPYSPSEYKRFFQGSLLTDNYRIIEEEIKPEFTTQFIKKAVLIGRDKSLELEVYEVQHNSENDPRVGISKDFFRLMASYGSKRALAIFHSPKSKNYRLSLATVEYSLDDTKIKREYSNPRRYSFFLGPDAKVHTPYDFLIKKGRVKDFDDLQNRFSIEVVNKEFYKEIANWYFWTLKKVKFPDDAEAEKNGKEISVIRLITRLIFIWFMKVRKLVPEELFNEIELKGILTDLKLNNDNYYKAVLQNLFFATLNTKQEERRFTSKKKGYKGFSQDFGNHNVYRYEELFNDSEDVIEKYFMPIPFLNGGLFECLDYKTKARDERKYIDGFTSTKSQQPFIPNFLFFSDDKEIDLNKDYGTTNKKYSVRGLINTLSLYNFTIDESDPNDADVSLDPELLGKVFENLLASYNPETSKTAREFTASFYTPREIVDYMVDESLKQYFKSHIETEDIDNKLQILLSSEDQSNPFDVVLSRKLVNLIDSLRVVDPAVGSGAFPMRILNRLVFLLHKLDPDNSLWKQSQINGIKKSVKDPTLQRKFIDQTERKFKEKNPDYGRKLYLIEKCIYGVDIQQIAVEIAKLRFFISLLVDEKVENDETEPLPNLDFKLMQGNSLISSFAGIDFAAKQQKDNNLFDFDEKYKLLIEEFEELKSHYQNEPDVHKKRKLRDDIDAKLLEIFQEKLKLHYPQLKELESKYSGRKEIIEVEKKKLFKKIGIDLEQAEQDLIAYTEGRMQKDFFLWDIYFAEVFAEKNGFDIVIGNPPYISYYSNTGSSLSIKEKNYFATNYSSVQKINDRINSMNLMTEKGIRLLKENGHLAYITNKTIAVLPSYIEIRRFILDNTTIKYLVTDLDPFEAIVDCVVFGVDKLKNDANYKLKWHKGDINKSSLKEVIQLRMNTNLEFHFSSNQKIINKINSTKERMQDYILINRGVNIGGCFDKFLSSTKKNKKYWKYLSGTKNINRYSFNWSQTDGYMIFDLSLEKKLREKGETLVLGDHDRYNKERLFIPESGQYLMAAYCDEEYYSAYGIMVGTSLDAKKSLKYPCALLNSKLLTYYAIEKEILRKGKKATPHIGVKGIKVLPIPECQVKTKEKIIAIVDKIITTKKQNPEADTQHLENQIDIMVFKLYNLTYEEVKIIDPEIEKIISEKDYEKFEIN